MTEIVTESIHNLFLVKDSVTSEDFKKFIYSYKNNIVGIQSIEWIPKVKGNDKNNFIENARNTINTDYNIYEINGAKNLVPVGEKENYFPILFLEPYEGNQEVLGFDISSDPKRRQALEESIELNKFIVTDPINLIQEHNNDFGLRFFEPVFENTGNESSKNDFSNLKGIVSGVIKPKDIINNVVSFLKPNYNIYISYQNNQNKIIELCYCESELSKKNVKYKINNAEFSNSKIFNYGGKNWTINAVSIPSFLNDKEAFIPSFISLVILIGTVLLFFYIKKNEEENIRINNIVEDKTKELKYNKERLDLAINSAEIGIWDWDLKNGKLYWNEKCFKMLGYKDKEFIPTFDNVLNLLHPNDKENTLKNLFKHLENSNDAYDTKYRIRAKNGYWKWIHVIGKVIERDEKGKSTRIIGVHLDITESKQIELKLQTYSYKLESMNANKEKLLSIIAHDLKSPLTSVKGFAEYVLSDKGLLSVDEIKNAVGYIYESSNNFQKILEGLLDWGRAIRNQLEFEPMFYNLKEQVEEIINQQRINLKKKEITIFDKIKDVNVFADKKLIDVTLRNILGNAIKFTPKNGTITISQIENKDDSITISISDNGIGMTKEMVDNLFKDTYTTSERGTEGEKGTGLGLAICREIINNHEGEIWVESKENIGTTIYFTLKTKLINQIVKNRN
jgi:PAS domain S-box-containing protein